MRGTILCVNALHGLAANVFAALVFLHALAALFHHYVQRKTVLRRMATKD
ncbi:cytochrome b/b6 domain-containing protein [Luteibacter sp. HA06]